MRLPWEEGWGREMDGVVGDIRPYIIWLYILYIISLYYYYLFIINYY